jgi:hypothetical protein
MLATLGHWQPIGAEVCTKQQHQSYLLECDELLHLEIPRMRITLCDPVLVALGVAGADMWVEISYLADTHCLAPEWCTPPDCTPDVAFTFTYSQVDPTVPPESGCMVVYYQNVDLYLWCSSCIL